MTHGIPINEQSGFLEKSRRGGIASGEARRRRRIQVDEAKKAAGIICTVRPPLSALEATGLVDYIIGELVKKYPGMTCLTSEEHTSNEPSKTRSNRLR